MFLPVEGHVWLRSAPLGQARPAGFELTGDLETSGQTNQRITLGTDRAKAPQICGLCKRPVYQHLNEEPRDEERTFTCGHSLHVVCLEALGTSWVERGRSWDSQERAAGVCPACHPGSAGHDTDSCKCCTSWKIMRKGETGGKCTRLAVGTCELYCHLKHDQTKPPRERKARRIFKKSLQEQEQQIAALRYKLDEVEKGMKTRKKGKAELGNAAGETTPNKPTLQQPPRRSRRCRL